MQAVPLPPPAALAPSHARWNGHKYPGPAALLHVYRWMVDSRDGAGGERIRDVGDPFK